MRYTLPLSHQKSNEKEAKRVSMQEVSSCGSTPRTHVSEESVETMSSYENKQFVVHCSTDEIEEVRVAVQERLGSIRSVMVNYRYTPAVADAYKRSLDVLNGVLDKLSRVPNGE